MKDAKDCRNIHEIRSEIDAIDYQIIALFGKRLNYVGEIVKFKSDQVEVVAMGRQQEIFQK